MLVRASLTSLPFTDKCTYVWKLPRLRKEPPERTRGTWLRVPTRLETARVENSRNTWGISERTKKGIASFAEKVNTG